MSEESTGKKEQQEPVRMVQMELSFATQYSDIALKDAVRGVKVIAREAIRFGAKAYTVKAMLEILSTTNPIIYAAADAIDEAIPD